MRPTIDSGMPGTASGSAYQQLRDTILEGEWRPGTHLSEAFLSERFGVSRTPVREAVAQLVNEGLLRRRAGGGVVVATATLEEVLDALSVLGALQGLCARLVCERVGPRGLRRLEDAVTRFEAAVGADDPDEVLSTWFDLNELFWVSSENASLQRLMPLVGRSEQRMRHSTLLYPGRAKQCVADWRDLLDAFRHHDPDSAEQLARDHWNRTRDIRAEIEQDLERQRQQKKLQEGKGR